MKRSGGLITEEDLAAYQAVERVPVKGTYRGYDIVSMPPPSSGGTHVIQILNILEGFPIGELGFGSAEDDASDGGSRRSALTPTAASISATATSRRCRSQA